MPGIYHMKRTVLRISKPIIILRLIYQCILLLALLTIERMPHAKALAPRTACAPANKSNHGLLQI